MSKALDTRLDETIAFIRNTAQLARNAAWRKTVADYCRDWRQRATQLLQDQVSELISQGWTKDGAANRSYRRAMALLDFVGSALEHNTVVEMPAGTFTGVQAQYAVRRNVRGANFSAHLDDKFELFLGRAGCKQFIDAQLFDLKSNTLGFLADHRLKIGGAKGGRQSYKFTVYPDSEGLVTYGLSAGGKQLAYEPLVEVVNVPATSFRDTKKKEDGLKKIIGTEVKGDGGAVIMTTTQFTGCSFCMQRCGDGIVAAHMDPEGVAKNTGLTGPGIRGELMDGEGFAFDTAGLSAKLKGDPVVYGCKAIGDGGWGYDQANRSYMTIIGIYGDDGWDVFTQFNATDGSMRASQIFPPN